MIFSSTNFSVAESNVPFAVATSQLSQYHHLLSESAQGGIVTHEIFVQLGHGFVTPSPEKRTTLDAIKHATQTRTPKDLYKTRLHLWQLPPKNLGETNLIVLNPHRNPYIIPPRWVKLSINGVKPMRQLTTMSKKSIIKTLAWLSLAPRSLTKSLKNKFQFIVISDRQAPIKPKIPPLAPTVMYSGKKIALKMIPPTADTVKMTAVV